ncbi:MAG: hypothetical protein P1P90_00100 [Patescibacteria group bacterium]|nr:hypothetical protein [Patescibacteria group bacterium]
MSWSYSGSVVVKIKRMHFLLSWLMITVAALSYSSTARAEESEWCVRELDRSDLRVLVLHNPKCDLRVLPRMYPQKDDDGKALPMQVQLRSLFAANQTREENGVKQRYTVMRGCVTPGIPSKDADAEELAMCPKGLMNYFSAPASDGAARIVIPAKRQLTIAERNLELARVACAQLQDKPLVDDADKKAAASCAKQFTTMVFGESANAPARDRDAVEAKELKSVKEPEVAKVVPGNSTVDSKKADDKGQFVIPFFILLIGLAIYGPAITVLAIKINREKVALKNTNQTLNLERRSRVQVLRKEAKESAEREYLEKNEFQLKLHKDKIEKDLKDAWNKLLADQQKEIASLKKRNEELQNSGFDPWSLNELKNQLAGKDQQIFELRSEMSALAERNTLLETKAREALAGRVALESRISELSNHAKSVKTENADLRRELAQKDQQIEDFRYQVTAGETALLGYEGQIRDLENRVERLLTAVDGCETGIGIDSKSRTLKDTLPLGLKADQLAQIAKDDDVKITADDFPGENETADSLARNSYDSGVEKGDSEITTDKDALRSPKVPNDLVSFEQAPYRQEMPTLEQEIPLQRIAQEQMIHFRNAWVRLAQEVASVLDPNLRITEYSNAESVLSGLMDKLFTLTAESKKASDRLVAMRQEHRFVEDELEKAKGALSEATNELNVAMQVNADMRHRFDELANDIKGDKIHEKMYAYQWATVQADARAVKAEIRFKDAEEEVSRLTSQLSDRDREMVDLKNERSLLEVAKEQLEDKLRVSSDSIPAKWSEERATGSTSAFNQSIVEKLRDILGLGQKDIVPARDVLLQLPNNELLRLTKSVFHTLADRVQNGVQLEYPIASDRDLSILRATVMMPLVGDYPYVMPKVLLNMAGTGAPRMYNVIHDAFAGIQHSEEGSVHKMTVRPPAGVPEHQNDSVHCNSDRSGVQARVEIGHTSESDDDTSRSVS